MMASRRPLALVAFAGTLHLLGCSSDGGTTTADGSTDGQGAAGSIGPGTGGSVGEGGEGGASGAGGAGGPTLPAPDSVTRVARLTHDQYQNTVRDLLGIEDAIAQGFAPDAQNSFPFDSSIHYVVDSRLAAQYRTAAETLAERVVSDAEVFARVVPCEVDAPECPSEFISSFGLKAFRRPLTAIEEARFAGLFEAGESLVESGDAFLDGVRVVVEALLQSPDFLYRTELPDAANPGEPEPLTSYQMATRLAYFLYNSTPDDGLLAAAANDQLTTAAQVRAEVERLLGSERTLDRIVEFHEQAFNFGRYARISLDPDTFPDVPADLADRALTASRMFVKDVVQGGGGLTELLTADHAYADAGLAPLYGADVAGDFERIEFAASERPGLLTQVGFLASHAYAKKTDPIHRGLFVVRDLLCQEIPDPPAGASTTPPPAGAPTPKTTREEVDILTSQKSCIGCHSIINPPGFAFEAFDAAGVFRENEDGTPVETDGSIELDGQVVEFAGATELVLAVAESQDAQSCYVAKWVKFAHGRELSEDEVAEQTSLPTDLGVLELLPLIVTQESFMTRPNDEVSP